MRAKWSAPIRKYWKISEQMIPAYFPYPKFLLQMSLSHTARLTYVLLLDRMTLSQKNQINKNNLRLNQLNRTKEAYGRYRNVFLEDYSELEMEIAELDTLIEDLSAYMQSTGRKYADHAATLRSWSARKKRQQKPGAGIPDYTYNKEESL